MALKKHVHTSLVEYLNENADSIKDNRYLDLDELIAFIENNSSLVLNNTKDEEVLIFTTRKNSSPASETYSVIDYNECIELIILLRSKFSNYTFSIDTVDEWVNINVTKKDFYEKYEPESDNIGYVFSYEFKNGKGSSLESRNEYGTYSGIEKHREYIKKLCKRYSIVKTADEVIAIADSLPIPKPFGYSERVLIQKADESVDGFNANFYIARREIW